MFKTNVTAPQNVVDASIDSAKKVVACRPIKPSSINLYGATKLTPQTIRRCKQLRLLPAPASVVRYGNVPVVADRLFRILQDLARSNKSIPITDERMTRFWITLPDAVEFVVNHSTKMNGGEPYAPRIPSMKIIDLAKAIAPDCLTL